MNTEAKVPAATTEASAAAPTSWRVELEDLAFSVAERVGPGENGTHWRAKLDRAQAAHTRGDSVEAWLAHEDALGSARFLY